MSKKQRKVRAGVSLLELMVVLVMMGFLTYALIYAFIGGIDQERRQAQRQSEQNPTARIERRMTRLLTESLLSEDTTDQTTYFVAATENDGALGADRLTFTTTAPGLSIATQESTDDFTTQHEQHGPHGGVAEVSFGLTPIGEAGNHTGLFERLQIPADGDDTQGGTEGVLEATVAQLGFQFYDGTQWTSEWDTLTSGTRRLPQAVRVSYTLTGETSSQVHTFDVLLPASDVDANNPVTSTTGGTS